MKKTIIIECKECQGTGLYKGMCERDNCATICNSCKGDGKVDFTYNEFEKRKIRTDIKRVFKSSYGYIHSDEDTTTEDGEIIKFSNGGCTYEEWLDGVEPKPVKSLYCPYICNNRGKGNEPLDSCKVYCKGFGSISGCEIYHKKEECWTKFELKK